MIENVEELLNKHGIKFISRGNSISCLCPNPSHNDTHIGNFSFSLTKGVGHCFVCGCSVNIFSFNKLLGEKIDSNGYNPTFLQSLKPKHKEEISYSKPIVYGKMYNPIYNKNIMDFLHNNLGWNDKFIEEKQVKYCRYTEMISESLLRDPSVDEEDKKPTKMQNRICIPIFKNGKLINYECRTFDNDPIKVKYVHGCSSNLIYNFENIDLTKEVVLTEGIKNLGKAYTITKNIISSFGNQLTDIKLEMLNKIPKLTVFLDNDDGGLTMAKKLKENYNGELRATFCPKFYKKDSEIKGFDMNDCTLQEINYYLNHVMSIDKAIQRLSNSDKDNQIFWL